MSKRTDAEKQELMGLHEALVAYVDVVRQSFMQTEIGRNCLPYYADILTKAGDALKKECGKLLSLLVLAFLLAGCSTNSGPVTHSDPAWIFARGQLDRQTALLERIAAALEKPREVVPPNLGGPYYFPNPIPWAWPTNGFAPLQYQWAPTSSWRIVTNYCTLEGVAK